MGKRRHSMMSNRVSEHAEKRAHSRGIELPSLDEIDRQIAAGEAPILETENRNGVMKIIVNGLVLVYAHKRRVIVTVLPDDCQEMKRWRAKVEVAQG
jgi:hypothetical protein